MARVFLSTVAQADILEIWAYIADDNVGAADAWIDRLDEHLSLWASQPGIGRLRSELAPGLRSLPFGRYVAFFLAVDGGIEIVRVLHGSRDIDDQFP